MFILKISKRSREDSIGQGISTAAVENEPVSMKFLLSLIGHVCKILLVPLPHVMVNKVAFMPPNKHYQLVDYKVFFLLHIVSMLLFYMLFLC
jgi:hypothetical protein